MAGDARTQLVTIPLAIGMNNTSFDEVVQPSGQRPRLLESRNTRLSKVPGLVSKAPGATLLASGITGPVGGLIPTADRDSTLMPIAIASANRRIDGSAINDQVSANIISYYQDGYFPVQVSNAGYLPGGRADFNPAIAYVASTGMTYFAHIDSANWGIVISAIADDGRVAMPARSVGVYPTNGTANFLGLSSYGTNVLLWAKDPGSNAIQVWRLSIGATGEVAVLGAATATIYTPANVTMKNVAIAYDPDDTANVYLVSQNSAVATSITINRVSTSTLTVTTVQTIALGVAWDHVALSYMSHATHGNLLVLAVSRTGGSTNFYELSATALTTTWTAAAVLTQGNVACGFWCRDGSTVLRILAVSQTMAATPGTNNTQVLAYTSAGATSAFLGLGAAMRSLRIVGQMVTHKATSNRLVPYLTCINQWANTGSYDPASANFVSETSVEVYRAGYAGVEEFTCCARLGTDQVMRYPGNTITGDYAVTSSCSVIVVSDKITLSYLAENIQDGVSVAGYRPRYVSLDLASAQPQFAYEAGGAAIIAGAMPVVWDGAEVAEYSPQRASAVTVANTGGGALNGSHLFAAVIQWKDAQGNTRRSPPSNVATLTGAAFTATMSVFVPQSFRRSRGTSQSPSGHEYYTIIPYVSEASGLVLYAQATILVSVGINMVTFAVNAEPTVDAFHPALYTDGSATQELPSFCPNACKSVAVIQDRVWMLDAEKRGRGYFSKPKVEGFFPQMNPDCTVTFPASAGDLRCVIGYNSAPIFLGDSGIWTVAGEGPDALLNPPDFASPQQISDVPCTQRNSVVRSPAGVFFVSNNRFARFDGAAEILHDVDAQLYGNIVGTAVFSKYSEVCFFTAQGYVHVYNWEAGGWTLWDTTVTGVTTLTGCAQIPTSGKVLYYGDSGELWLMDPDTVSTTAQISLSTGWILFGGPQDDNSLGDMVLHAKRSGAHGLTVTTTTDYDGSAGNTVTQTYSAAEVLSGVADTTNAKRYDLQPEVVKKHARALQLVIVETGASSEAFQPASLSIEVIKEAGKAARGLYASGRK